MRLVYNPIEKKKKKIQSTIPKTTSYWIMNLKKKTK
jgi:hypothetical protein